MQEVMYLQNTEDGELIQFDSTCDLTRRTVQQWLQSDLAFSLESNFTDDLIRSDSLVWYNREEARRRMYAVGIFAHKWHGRAKWRLVPELDSIDLVREDNPDLIVSWVQDREYPKLTDKEMMETYNKFVPFKGEINLED